MSNSNYGDYQTRERSKYNNKTRRYSDNANYKKTVENSINSRTGREKIEKSKTQVLKETVLKHRKKLALLVAGVLITGAAVTVPGIVNDILAINNYVNDFKIETVAQNTHRTDDGANYWYDTNSIVDTIEQRIIDGEDVDVQMYCVSKSMKYSGPGEVISKITNDECQSIDDYAKKTGYESLDEFNKVQETKILYEEELAKMQPEQNEKQGGMTL